MSGDGERPRRTFTADRGDDRERLDRVLLRHLADLPEASRTKIQEWIDAGLVTVNGRAVTKTAAKVAAGDLVDTVLPPPPLPKPELIPQDIPLSVLFEDEHLLVLDKPPGLVVHPAVGHRDGTLVNALLFRLAGLGRRGRPARPRPPPRQGHLRRPRRRQERGRRTPGMAKAMKARTLVKEYLAVVYGRTAVTKGKVDLRIQRDPRDRKRMATSKTEGRESTTLYERLGESTGEKAGLSLLLCTLVTGRTHQIRVHLKAIHHPDRRRRHLRLAPLEGNRRPRAPGRLPRLSPPGPPRPPPRLRPPGHARSASTPSRRSRPTSRGCSRRRG